MNLTESIRNDITIVNGGNILAELEEYFTIPLNEDIPLNEGVIDFAKDLAKKVKAKWADTSAPANPQQLAQAETKLKSTGGGGLLSAINQKLGKSVAALGLIVALTTALSSGAVQAADADDIANAYMSQAEVEQQIDATWDKVSSINQQHQNEAPAVQKHIKAKWGVDSNAENPQQLKVEMRNNPDLLKKLGIKTTGSPTMFKKKVSLIANVMWKQGAETVQTAPTTADTSVEKQVQDFTKAQYQQQDAQKDVTGMRGDVTDPSEF